MNGRIKVAALGLFVVLAGGSCGERTAEVAPPLPPAAPPPEPVLQYIPAAPSPAPERERPRAPAARAAKTHVVPPIGRRAAIDRSIEDPPRIEPRPPRLPELQEQAPPLLEPPLLEPPLMPPPLVLSALPDRAVTAPSARARRSSNAGLESAVMGGVGVAGVAIGFAGAEMYQQSPSSGALALTLLGAATTVIGFTFSAVIQEDREASSPSGPARAQQPVLRVGVGPATAFAGVTY